MDLTDKSGELEERLRTLAEQVATTCGLTIYDLEYHDSSKLLRIYILNPQSDTASLDECVQMDRAMTDPLEVEWVPENLTLEVSSPGLNRHLRTIEHFKWAQGREIVVIIPFKLTAERFKGLPKSYQGQGRFNALILSADLQQVLLSLPVKEQEGYQLTLKYQEIKKANLEFRI